MAEIALELVFDPEYVMSLCNVVRLMNVSELLRNPHLPLLYDSGVVYQREGGEVFRDVVHLYKRGADDCDTLAPARAGELLARGWKALAPGEGGYELAQRKRPSSINAWCYFTTRDDVNGPGPKLWHVEVMYEVAGQDFTDDPSARLGMYDGFIDPKVEARWAAAGVTPGEPVREAASVGFLPLNIRGAAHDDPRQRRRRRRCA